MAVVSSTKLQTKYGTFTVSYHQDKVNYDYESCLSISHGDVTAPDCIVRLHSSCIFSETFRSIDCDCSLQLEKSLELISSSNGVIIYLFQEGRGVGLANKIKAMELERTEHLDTADAFKKLHFDLDPRKYTIAIQALKDLHIAKVVKLISNNPRKRMQLEKGGFSVKEEIKLKFRMNDLIKKYLNVKKTKLGHKV